MSAGEVLFGYGTVTGVPLCPCRDPGNHLMLEATDEPLHCRLRCWCGRTVMIAFDDEAEQAAFVEHRGADWPPPPPSIPWKQPT